MIEGRKLRTLRGHSGKVYHASFSPDGRASATASYDNTVKLWKPDGSLLATLEGHSDGVLHVSFSPDGQTLTTASYDGTIKLWTLDGTLISTLRGHRDGVNAAVCSPDGQTLATASNDHTVLLWTLDPDERPEPSAEPGLHLAARLSPQPVCSGAGSLGRVRVRGVDGVRR